METRVKIYRIGLRLPEPEAVALARLATDDMRDLRDQAHFLLRSKLIELGALDVTGHQTNHITPNVQS